MKLAILSRNKTIYSTKRLAEVARQRGYTVKVFDPLRCYLQVTHNGSSLHYKGSEISGYRAVIPRIGSSITRYGTVVLRQLELMGCYSANSADAILKARDKLWAHQLLAAKNIDMPVTVFGDNPDDTNDLLNLLGPAPHIIKLNEGSQGVGVMLTEKLAASRGAVDALRELRANFLIQEFIPEAQGTDLRCFVIGNKVVAAMQRRAVDGDFRSNLHRGGLGEHVELSAAEKNIAIRSAKALGLSIAGVDILRSRRGPLVLEVNSTPGLEGIEAVTGLDIAAKIVDFLTKNIKKA